MPDKNERTTERRTMLTRASAFQTREDGDDLIIEGYFATFEGEYVMGDWGVERVDPHAFDETVRDDVRALINHDTTLVLGRTSARTLELNIDSHGLYGRVKVNRADQDAMNCYERIKRGDVNQCSFGFSILEEKWEDLPGGRMRWTLLRVKLYEVSVCTFPAYEDTAVVARARDYEALRARELESWKTRMQEKIKHKKEETTC